MTTTHCHHCNAEIERIERGYFFRGTYRALCADLQACAERATELHLGWTVAEQRAYVAGAATLRVVA